MKSIYLIFLFLVLGGCASLTTAPKENVKAVFTAVKNRNFDNASSLYESANVTRFSVFEGGGAAFDDVNAEEIRILKDRSISFLKKCDDLVMKARYLNSGKAFIRDDGTDGELMDMSSLKEAFLDDCELSGKDYFRNDLLKIKQYSTVDILAEIPTLKKSFYSETSMAEMKAKKKLRELEVAEKLKKEKQGAYENSEEYYSKKLCEIDDRIKLAKTVITSENEVGSVSGYVDKKKLYDAGKVIQINQDRIKHFSDEFKAKFGKSWDASECK
ncbi:MAG: hypothetical protein JNM24_17865 [Bdellovibrionaceae bacterium]|nr:hypothetical protein [Pseudobdellovibrionaceae bacterium]